DLAKVTPFWNIGAFDVLVQHRHDANWEVARDPAADLEKADRKVLAGAPKPIGEFDHIFNAGTNGVHIAKFTGDIASGLDVSQGAIFPTGYEYREAFLGGSHHPTLVWIDLVEFF